MNTPNPSKAQEWWQEKPFCSKWLNGCGENYDIPAIIRESQARLLERVTRIVQQERNTDGEKYNKVIQNLRKMDDKTEADFIRAERDGTDCAYDVVLRRLSSISNGDVENKGV